MCRCAPVPQLKRIGGQDGSGQAGIRRPVAAAGGQPLAAGVKRGASARSPGSPPQSLARSGCVRACGALDR